MLDVFEKWVDSVPDVGGSVEVPQHLFDMQAEIDAQAEPPQVSFKSSRGAGQEEPETAVSVVELVSLESFGEQWGMVHDLLGGMVQSRTGQECALGDQSRSEGGRVACNAAYELISANPALSKLILSTQSTFFGQLMAVGMHGFACVQLVRASAPEKPPETHHEVEIDQYE